MQVHDFSGLCRWAVGIVLTACLAPTAATAQENRILGESLYQMGMDLEGSPVSATVMDDVKLSGSLVACAKCHRRSGFGNEEPGKLTPSITAGELFSPTTFDRSRRFRSLYQEPQTDVERAGPRMPHPRPAYDEASLSLAIAKGVDPSGRTLDALMPRYDLDDEAMDALTSYLSRLSQGPDPGVDQSTIHFAFVTTGDVDPATRTTAKRVIDAYVEDHNREVLRYQQHEGNSPNYKDDFIASYRCWRVHDWQLAGEPYTYGAQLSRFQRLRPVFALLGGVSNQSWQPIHQFCDRHQLPCLFPNTPLPAADAENGYTLYLHAGLRAESDAFCRDLSQRRRTSHRELTVDQFAIVDTVGEQAMRYTTSQLREAAIVPTNHLLATPDDLEHAMSQSTRQADVALVWIVPDQLPTGQFWTRQTFRRTYFSGTLAPSLSDRIKRGSRFAVLSPYRDESIEHPRSYRVRSWMRSRRIPLTDRRLRYNTYFALTVTDHALRHMVDRYSRDYLIERVEHETENSLNPGIYPALSLGPRQRYASRAVNIIFAP